MEGNKREKEAKNVRNEEGLVLVFIRHLRVTNSSKSSTDLQQQKCSEGNKRLLGLL